MNNQLIQLTNLDHFVFKHEGIIFTNVWDTKSLSEFVAAKFFLIMQSYTSTSHAHVQKKSKHKIYMETLVDF